METSLAGRIVLRGALVCGSRSKIGLNRVLLGSVADGLVSPLTGVRPDREMSLAP